MKRWKGGQGRNCISVGNTETAKQVSLAAQAKGRDKCEHGESTVPPRLHCGATHGDNTVSARCAQGANTVAAMCQQGGHKASSRCAQGERKVTSR